jgi:iron complex outermembrane receptor protein
MDAKYDESNMFSLDYSFNDLGKLFTELKVKMYASAEDHLMTNEYRPNASASLANTPVNSHNYGARFEFTTKPFANVKMHIGADFKQIAKDGMKEVTVYKNICTTPPTVYPTPIKKEFEVWQNSYSQDFGVFIDLQYYVNEKLKLKTGLRSDLIKSDIKDPEEDFKVLYNNDITPDDILNFNYYAQAKYSLPKNYSIEISAGHGTRNPSLLERYINHFTVGLDAYEYVGNPHLKSETNNQINLMLSQKNKFVFVYVNTFYSRINNYITAVEDTTIKRKFTACKEPKYAKRFVNIDNAEQYGINFGGNLTLFKYFIVNIDLTYTYAQNLEMNEPLPEIAPFTSIVSIIYKYKKLKAELQNEYQAEQKRISKLVGESETPAFSIINLKISYVLFKHFKFGLSVDNISNENYYRHLSRPYKNMDTQSMFYEPGRNFKILVKYSF